MKTPKTVQRTVAFASTLLLVCLALASCRKNLDEITVDDWEPIIALPLAYATFDVYDVLESVDSTQDVLEVGDNGQLALRYSSHLLSLTLDSVLTFDSQALELSHSISAVEATTVESAGVFNVLLDVPYNFSVDPDNIRIDEAELLSGSLELEVDFQTGEQVDVVITIAHLTDPLGQPFEMLVSASGTYSQDLTGYLLIPDHPTTYENEIIALGDVTVTNLNTYTSEEGDGVELAFSLNDLDFSYVLGDFGNIEIAMDPDSIDLSVFSNSVQVDDFGLAEATIDLNVTNSFGIPALFDLSGMESENVETGEITSLYVDNDFNLAGQATLDGPPEEITFTIDQDNSNLLSVVAPAPQILGFGAVAVANPDGPPPIGSPNFITNTSQLDVDVDVYLPLKGYVHNLVLVDTLAASIAESLPTEVDSVVFRLETDNTFPLGGELQILFLDSLYAPIDSLFMIPEELITPALVGNDGWVIAPSVAEAYSGMGHTRFEEIRFAHHVVVRAKLNTSEAATQTMVTFDDAATLGIKLGIKAFAHVTL